MHKFHADFRIVVRNLCLNNILGPKHVIGHDSVVVSSELYVYITSDILVLRDGVVVSSGQATSEF